MSTRFPNSLKQIIDSLTLLYIKQKKSKIEEKGIVIQAGKIENKNSII